MCHLQTVVKLFLCDSLDPVDYSHMLFLIPKIKLIVSFVNYEGCKFVTFTCNFFTPKDKSTSFDIL